MQNHCLLSEGEGLFCAKSFFICFGLKCFFSEGEGFLWGGEAAPAEPEVQSHLRSSTSPPTHLEHDRPQVLPYPPLPPHLEHDIPQVLPRPPPHLHTWRMIDLF